MGRPRPRAYIPGTRSGESLVKLGSGLYDTVGREGLYLPAIDDMTSPHQDQTLERGVMGAYLVRKYGGPS